MPVGNKKVRIISYSVLMSFLLASLGLSVSTGRRTVAFIEQTNAIL